MEQKETIESKFELALEGHVTESKYFFFDTDPKKKQQLAIIFGGFEKCAPDFEIKRRTYPYYVIEIPIKGKCNLKIGKKQYELMKCGECHGHDGKGYGPSSDTLKDDSGNKSWPFDFTTGALKRGSSAENVYLTFTTGLDGTPMPSYEDVLEEEKRWHLVSYTLELMKLNQRDH